MSREVVEFALLATESSWGQGQLSNPCKVFKK